MEARPGEELQVDFGLGASIDDGASRPRRSWVFRMVLSYSRKAYSEALLRQDTKTFLRCLENGLRVFGGVPLVCTSIEMTSQVRFPDVLLSALRCLD